MNFLHGFLMMTGILSLFGWILRTSVWLIRAAAVLCVDIVLRLSELWFRVMTRIDARYARAHFFLWKWRVTWDAFVGRDVSYLDHLPDSEPPDGPGSKAAAERAWHAKWDRK